MSKKIDIGGAGDRFCQLGLFECQPKSQAIQQLDLNLQQSPNLGKRVRTANAASKGDIK